MERIRLHFNEKGNYSTFYGGVMCGFCINSYSSRQVIFTGSKYNISKEDYDNTFNYIKLLYTLFMKDDTDETL